MARKPNDPMTVNYENDQLVIEWDYKIVKTNRGRSAQYSVAVNERFIKLTGIRQALFISKSPIPNTYILSTMEPPENVEYKLEKPHDSRIHIKINLPKNIMNLSAGQKIKLKYYPGQADYYNLGGPKIEAELYTPQKEPEITGKLQTAPNTPPKIKWEINKNVPDDLLPFLTHNQIEEIKKLKNATVILDVKTLGITIKPE